MVVPGTNTASAVSVGSTGSNRTPACAKARMPPKAGAPTSTSAAASPRTGRSRSCSSRQRQAGQHHDQQLQPRHPVGRLRNAPATICSMISAWSVTPAMAGSSGVVRMSNNPCAEDPTSTMRPATRACKLRVDTGGLQHLRRGRHARRADTPRNGCGRHRRPPPDSSARRCAWPRPRPCRPKPRPSLPWCAGRAPPPLAPRATAPPRGRASASRPSR
jgi:hypothetical protein